MKADYLLEKFAAGSSYDKYVSGGTDEQQRRWAQVYEAAGVSAEQARLIDGFSRRMHLLVVSGIWCGDCVQQVPLLQRIAGANPSKLDLRILDRDQHRDLAEQIRINTGDRVPVVLFLAEDGAFCSMLGDRTLSRYRALARKQLGAACPIAIAPPDADEMRHTLGEWLDEVERVQLMLRLSSRLRQKHND